MLEGRLSKCKTWSRVSTFLAFLHATHFFVDPRDNTTLYHWQAVGHILPTGGMAHVPQPHSAESWESYRSDNFLVGWGSCV